MRDKLILLFEVTTIHGLVRTLDLNSNGGLASLANWNSLVIALDGCAVKRLRQKSDKRGKKSREPKLTLYQYQ